MANINNLFRASWRKVHLKHLIDYLCRPGPAQVHVTLACWPALDCEGGSPDLAASIPLVGAGAMAMPGA